MINRLAGMKSIFIMVNIVFVNLIFSCNLFTARSDFYVKNYSSYNLSINAKTIYDTSLTLNAAINDELMIGSYTMIEIDDIKPSNIFVRISAIASINGINISVYNQDPILDNKWARVIGNGSKHYIYTLLLSDSDLTL